MNRKPQPLSRYAGYALTASLIVLVGYGGLEYASGGLPYTITSDNPSSMSKTINYGDLTINYLAPFNTLKIGDIIIFHDPRGNPGIITHRIIGITSCGGQECLITKGDNNATNPDSDPWNVTQRDYISKVEFVVPYLGYISPTLWGFSGYLVLLPLALVFLFVLFLTVVRSESNDVGPARVSQVEVEVKW